LKRRADDMYELKKLSSDALPSALAKAKQYRFLGEPDEAESICLDILAVDPDHQDALIVLLLSLTDKFKYRHNELHRCYSKALEILEKLDDSYCKYYYLGIIYEKRAKHHLKKEGRERWRLPMSGLSKPWPPMKRHLRIMTQIIRTQFYAGTLVRGC
jgi:tetratricopeptide (TPR) repeat protein